MFGMNESAWFAAAAGLALKSTAVMSLAWLAAFLLRRRSAAVRHLVWTSAAAAVVLLPVLSISLPPVAVPAASGFLAHMSISVAARGAAAGPSQGAVRPATEMATKAASRALPSISGWPLVLTLLWIVGALASLGQTLAAWIKMQRLRRSARPWPGCELAGELAVDLGIRQRVEVLETAHGTMPMAFGIIDPVVLIPSNANEWTEERRRVVLLHELAHIRRGDLVTHLLARLALIANWWNPLAWIAWREFLKESERAADDLVLRAGAAAPDYAGHLLAVARGMQIAPARGSAALAMARRSQLEERLMAILDSHVDRKTAGRTAVIASALFSIAMVAPVAALRAQDDSSKAIPSDIEATIKAAQAQKNYQMLDSPAAALVAARQYELAQKVLQSAAAIREQVDGSQSVAYGIGLRKLGDLEMKQSRYGSAEDLYTKALAAIGDQAPAAPVLIKLGVIMLHNKNPEAALAYFQRAQRISPSTSGSAWTWTAVAQRDNPEQAEASLRSALAVESDDSADAATTMELLADLLRAHGRNEEAQSLDSRAKAIRSTLAPRRKTTAGVYRIGGVVTPPKLLSKIEPEYTEEARLAKYQGTAVLYVEIGTDGVARNIQVARGLGLGLDDNAVSAITNWRFQPGTKDGAPVPVMATIEVNFRLM